MERFKSIFEGLDVAYGQHQSQGKRADGKQEGKSYIVKQEVKKVTLADQKSLKSLVAILKQTKRGVNTSKYNAYGQNDGNNKKKPRVRTAYQRIKDAQNEFKMAIEFKKSTALENRRIFVDEGLMNTKIVKNINIPKNSCNR